MNFQKKNLTRKNNLKYIVICNENKIQENVE